MALRQAIARFVFLLFLIASPVAARAEVSGWIAAQAPGETSTRLVGTRGMLPASDLSIGVTAELSTDVNLRVGPADWRKPLAILKKGTPVSIADVKVLTTKAGERQLWLRVVGQSDAGAPTNPAAPGGDHGQTPVVSPAGGNHGQTPAAPPIVVSPTESESYAAACKAGLDRQVAAQQAAGVLPQDRDIYTDPDGLIVHRKDDGFCDGGDTAQREGWYWLGVWLRSHTPGMKPWPVARKLTFQQVLKLLEPHGDGVFYRHPKLAPWNNPTGKEWGTSRDQLTPLIAAMGVWHESDTLRRLWDTMPYDVIGKHAFNGNWRNFLGQDGWNCSDIKKMDCSAVGDCSLQEDKRSCDLQSDDRDCSLQTDNRDCSAGEDTRDCGDLDLGCKAAKAFQNGLYATQKATCEASKTTQNGLYATQKAACETSKSTQNGLYATQKLTCETGKTGQNAMYAGEKTVCEAGKSGGKALCEVTKAAAYQLCRLGNLYSGDLMGPETVAMYRRGIGENPMIPSLDDFLTIVGHSELGDAESLANTIIRVSKSSDPDDTGDDLNHIVAALVAARSYPSVTSQISAVTYASQRQISYGSYLGEYYKHYGSDMTDITARIKAGIAAGWKPDASSVYGAIKWYHRPASGANPLLAKLYEPIIAYYFYGPGLIH